MIQIKGLKLTYWKSGFSLFVNDLRLENPEIIGITGRNGSGKTTLMKLLVDLLRADSGDVFLFGCKNSVNEAWKMYTGVYLDESFLIEFLSAEEYFDFIIKTGEGRIMNSIDELKDFSAFFNNEILNQKKYIRDFSAGNKAKIGIAAALISGRKLVILDEPFAHLDLPGTSILKDLIRNQFSRLKTGFLISSHDLSLLTELCDRIIFIESGRIIDNIITKA